MVSATSFYDGRQTRDTDGDGSPDVFPKSGINVSPDGGISTWNHVDTFDPDACTGLPEAEEPSAFSIAVAPDDPKKVFIGTNCGIARSADGGITWDRKDLDPADPLSGLGRVWDVVALAGGIVYVCGDDGLFRSDDAGASWTAKVLPGPGFLGTPLPTEGRCSIAASPLNDNVLFAIASEGGQFELVLNFVSLFESDDGGDTWTELDDGFTSRIPFVVTSKVNDNEFDLYFGDAQKLRRERCDNPPPSCLTAVIGDDEVTLGDVISAGLGGTMAAHADSGDLVFDPAEPLCPLFYSNDGGVYKSETRQQSSTPPCGESWVPKMDGIQGLWLWDLAGTPLPPPSTSTGLYFGTQDNGLWTSIDGGQNWKAPDIADVFDVATDGTTVWYTRCCRTGGGPITHPLNAPVANSPSGLGTISEIPWPVPPTVGPTGWLHPWQQEDSINSFGTDRFVLVTRRCGAPTFTLFDIDNGCDGRGAAGVFVTTDNGANWQQLGVASTPPGACTVQASRDASNNNNPTFYLLTGVCSGKDTGDDDFDLSVDEDPVGDVDGDGDPDDDGDGDIDEDPPGGELLKYVTPGSGTCVDFVDTSCTGGTWQKVELTIPEGGEEVACSTCQVGVFGVDPRDPKRLFVAELGPSQGLPRMIRSNDGGAGWTPDTNLTDLTAGGDEFKLENMFGPTAGTTFRGYAQPSLVAFSPVDRDTLVAAGRDSGVFVSKDNGANWIVVQVPKGKRIPRAYHAYFDPSGDIFIGTQGRGAWKIVDVTALSSIIESIESMKRGLVDFMKGLIGLAPSGSHGGPHLSDLDKVLPLLDISLTDSDGLNFGEVLDFGPDLDAASITNLSELADALEELSGEIGGVDMLINANPGLDGDVLTLSLDLSLSRLVSVAPNFSGEGDLGGVSLGGNIDLLLGLNGSFDFGLDLSLLDPADQTTLDTAFFLDDASLELRATAAVRDLVMEGNLGFISISTDDPLTPTEVEGATIDVAATFSVAIGDPDGDGRTTLDEFLNGDLTELIDFEFSDGLESGNAIEGRIPIRTNLFDATNGGAIDPRIEFNASLQPSDVNIQALELDEIDPVGNLTPLGVLTALRELLDWLDGFQSTGLLDTKLPFVDADVSDLLTVSERLATVLEELEDEEGAPTFGGAEDFAAKLVTAFNDAFSVTLPDPNLQYDANNKLLKFDLSFGDSASGSVPLDFSALEGLNNVIDIGADASLVVGYNLNLTLGFDLRDFPDIPTEGPDAGENSCSDGIDNDGDGAIDALDSDDCGPREAGGDTGSCTGSAAPECNLQEGGAGPGTCYDGIDNDGNDTDGDTTPDGDLFTDLADGDCVLTLEDRLFIVTDGADPELTITGEFTATNIVAKAQIGILEVGVSGGQLNIGAQDGGAGAGSCTDDIDNDGANGIDLEDPDCRLLTVDLISADGRITLPDLFTALSDLGSLVEVNIDAAVGGSLNVAATLGTTVLASGTIEVDGGLSGPLAAPGDGQESDAGDGSCKDNIDNDGDGDIDEVDTDCFAPLLSDDNLHITTTGLDDLAAFDTDDPFALLLAIIEVLEQFSAQFEENAEDADFTGGSPSNGLPLIGKSFNDIFSFAGEIGSLADSLRPVAEEDCADGGDTTFQERDDDKDGFVNDGCPQQGAEPEAGQLDSSGAPACANDADDDDDVINDGCPIAQPTLQRLETQIEGILELNDTDLSIGLENLDDSVDGRATDLVFRLTYGDNAIKDGTLNVGLGDLANDSSLVGLNVEGEYRMTVGGVLNLSFGVALDEITSATSASDLANALFILDTTEYPTGLTVDASVHADSFTVGANLGPLNVQIGNLTPVGEDDCGDNADTDEDGIINDGCAEVDEAETDCADNIDTDGDGTINDGCDATADPAKVDLAAHFEIEVNGAGTDGKIAIGSMGFTATFSGGASGCPGSDDACATLPFYFGDEKLGNIEVTIADIWAPSPSATFTGGDPNAIANLVAGELLDLLLLQTGLADVFAFIETLLNGEIFGFKLPLIGDQLDEGAGVTDALKTHLIGAITGANGTTSIDGQAGAALEGALDQLAENIGLELSKKGLLVDPASDLSDPQPADEADAATAVSITAICNASTGQPCGFGPEGTTGSIECTNALDDDGDGFVNDGCGQVGDESETDCADAGDTTFAERDDDGDGTINDGCPARGPGATDVEEIVFEVKIGQSGQTAANIPFDIGFPGLGLTSDGAIDFEFSWAMNLGFGVSKQDGVFIKTHDGDANPEELFIRGAVKLGNANLAASLGFIDITITDAAPLDDDVSAAFTIDLKDPGTGDQADKRLTLAEATSGASFSDMVSFDLTGGVDVELQIVTSVEGGAALPKLSTILTIDWAWDNISGNDADALESGRTDFAIMLEDVKPDPGSFLTDFLRPVIEDVQEFTGPLQPVIDVVGQRVPVLSDLAGEDITLLSLINALGDGDTQMLEDVITILTFVNGLPTSSSAPEITIGGGFTLNEDILDEPIAPSQARSVFKNPATELDPLASVTTQLPSGGPSGFKLAELEEAQLRFPFLDEPSQLMTMLFGKDVTLVEWRPPAMRASFGYSQSFGPIWAFPPIFVHIGGSATIEGRIGFGYDTEGIRNVIDGADAPALLQGIFITDLNAKGVDVPELSLRGELLAGAAIDLLIIKVGAVGGVFLTLGIDLDDPNADGKMKFREIADIIERTGNPVCIFSLEGKFGAFLRVFAKLDLFFTSKTWQHTLAELTLLEFDAACEDQAIPNLAEKVGDTLHLNVGARSGSGDGERGAHTSVTEETITVTYQPGGDPNADPPITAPVYLISGFGQTETEPAAGITTIEAHAGGGDDTIALVNIPDSVSARIFGEGDNDIISVSGDSSDYLDGGLGMDAINAGEGDDNLIGGDGPDELYGGPGNDWILGDDGSISRPNVTLEGAAGDGIDFIDAGLGTDRIWGQGGDDTIFGGVSEPGEPDGNDHIHGCGGTDTIDGGDGADMIDGDDDRHGVNNCDSDDVTGAPDNIEGGNGDDNIRGGDEASPGDTIVGGAGTDTINGGGGDDNLIGGDGDDTIDGEGGKDIILGDNGEIVNGVVTLSSSSEPANTLGDTLSGGGDEDVIFGQEGVDTINGDGGNDDLIGGPGGDTIDGGSGDDVLLGDQGKVGGPPGRDVTLQGGGGADTMDGGDGADQLFGQAGDDDLIGGNGGDEIRGSSGQDFMLGGDGAIERAAANPFTFGLPDNDGVDTMFGDADDDRMAGSSANDVMRGGSGNDYMEGNAGSDYMEGNTGDDRMVGGTTDDSVGAGDVDDEMLGGNGNDVMLGDDGSIAAGGGAGSETLHADSETVGGGDTMNGNDGDDRMFGQFGRDTMGGDAGDDYMEGNHGADTMEGATGQDDMIGGTSAAGKSDENDPVEGVGDLMTGGTGHDVMAGDNAKITRDDPEITSTFSASVQDVVQRTVRLLDVATTTFTPVGGASGDDDMFGGGGFDYHVRPGRR